MIYRQIEKRLNQVFRLEAADIEPILKPFAPRHRHSMNGYHALSGVRCCRAETRAWYTRLARLLPDVRFDLENVGVWGPPHAMRAHVAWNSTATVAGEAATNSGFHEFRFAGTKVVNLSIHSDADLFAGTLDALAQNGVGEAHARPIGVPFA